MVLVLITGSTASGKSTLSTIVSKEIKSIIIPQDSFYKHDFVQFPYHPDMDDRMERTDSINWGGLLTMVYTNLKNHANVIVEGHCVMSCEELVKKADLIFYISKSKDDCKKRFMERYSDGLSAEQNDMKARYFETIAWPTHGGYVEKYVVKHALDDKFFKLPGQKWSAKAIQNIIENNI